MKKYEFHTKDGVITLGEINMSTAIVYFEDQYGMVKLEGTTKIEELK